MERKLATVMFVDLVDSTALVAASDPEVARGRVRRFLEQIEGCVEAHGGTIRAESTPGQGTRIVFTLPAGPTV
jgi:class 3 adenylate cyclase